MLCGLHFETRIPLILEHLLGFLPTCSQWPHPQLLTHTLQLCIQSVFFYKNNNLKNPSLALRGTGMKSRCSTWLQLVQVQILALSPSSAGSGEAMPIETRDTRGNKGWFYCRSKLIKASVCLRILPTQGGKSYSRHPETEQGGFLPTFSHVCSTVICSSKDFLQKEAHFWALSAISGFGILIFQVSE